jgi:hypothetical protein
MIMIASVIIVTVTRPARADAAMEAIVSAIENLAELRGQLRITFAKVIKRARLDGSGIRNLRQACAISLSRGIGGKSNRGNRHHAKAEGSK